MTAASLSDTGTINVTGSSASQALLDVNGLASIGAGASLGLDNHAAVSTTGSLVNDGHLRLDLSPGDGGSSLTVGGTLTNNYALNIGNAALSASDKVTAAALDNTNAILLRGSSANQALLDVTGGAGFGAREPERCSATVRRYRYRVRERADHQPGRRRDIGAARKRRLHRGQHGAGVEQRAGGARLDRRERGVFPPKWRLPEDDRRACQ